MSSTKFVFFCVFQPNQKNKMAAQPLVGWDIFDFSSETAEPERNSMNVDRKQDLNVPYHVCVFQADQKTKNGRSSQSIKKVAHCTQVHVILPFGSVVVITLR